VIDLYGRVEVGTKVVVLPAQSHRIPDQSAQFRSASAPLSLATNSPRAMALH
jgi:hypothetical protein